MKSRRPSDTPRLEKQPYSKAIEHLLEIEKATGTTRETKQLTAISTICWGTIWAMKQRGQSPNSKDPGNSCTYMPAMLHAESPTSCAFNLEEAASAGLTQPSPQTKDMNSCCRPQLPAAATVRERPSQTWIIFKIDMQSPGSVCTKCKHLVREEIECSPQSTCLCCNNKRPKQEPPSQHPCRICTSRWLLDNNSIQVRLDQDMEAPATRALDTNEEDTVTPAKWGMSILVPKQRQHTHSSGKG
jgi:hypothetical protein